MNRPVVRVVISAYNAASYLMQTITSVLEQSFQDFEILMLDDSSRDNTAGVVQKRKVLNLRYHRFCKNYTGPSLPRNVEISIATCRNKVLLDTNDLYRSGRLEVAVTFLEDHPEVVLGTIYASSLQSE